MNFSIWLAEILNSFTLVIVIVFVGYRDKVIALLCKLLHQVCTVRYASTKNDGLAWLAEYFVSFLDPLFDNISGDLHAPGCGNLLAPFSTDLFSPRHIDFFGDVDLQRGKPMVIHQPVICRATNDILIDAAQPFGERCGGESNDIDAGVSFDKLGCLLSGDMAFIDY